MSSPRQVFALLLAAAAALACEEEPPTAAPAPTAPWRADQAPTAPSASARAAPSGARRDDATPRITYSLNPASRVLFRLPAKLATPRGLFRIMSGSLELAPSALERSAASLEVDLGSILIEGEASQAEYDATRRARNWLALGDARPEAEVERLRPALFQLTAVEAVSASSPHQGRRLPPWSRDTARPASDAQDTTASSEAERSLPEALRQATAPLERRRVTFTAVGRLALHAISVERRISVSADFFFEGEPEPGVTPLAVLLTTARPLDVPLDEHDIQPRDARGRLAASELPLLGAQVGKIAKLECELWFTR